MAAVYVGSAAEPRPVDRRLPGMRAPLLGLLAVLLIGCASAPGSAATHSPSPEPTTEPTATAAPSTTAAPTATAAPSATAALRPLPVDVSGIPRPDQPSVVLQPDSPPGTVPVGEVQVLELGHCGLGSPIDFNSSLWNPIAGDDGQGGPLTQDQVGELINATTVSLLLIEPDLAQIQTPLGAIVTLERLPGGRAYYLCM